MHGLDRCDTGLFYPVMKATFAVVYTKFINPLAAEFIYLVTSSECAGPINRSTAVKGTASVGVVDHLKNYDTSSMSHNSMHNTIRASISKDNAIRRATDFEVMGSQVTAWRFFVGHFIKAAVFAATICGADNRGVKSFVIIHCYKSMFRPTIAVNTAILCRLINYIQTQKDLCDVSFRARVFHGEKLGGL